MSRAEETVNAAAIENAADKLVRQAFLFDFYGELLNEHQSRVYEAFVCDNFSLSEIAEDNGVSRQSVHDLIKRCDAILEQYEQKLKLLEKFQKMKQQITRIHELTSESEQTDNIKEIKQISGELLLEL